MMLIHKNLLAALIYGTLLVYSSLLGANGQRGLLHFRRDLEHQLQSYQNQRDMLDSIIKSSVYSARDAITGPARIPASGNVRFSDLVIPFKSLILQNHIAQPAVNNMINKTQAYVTSKLSEIYSLRSQVDVMKRQLSDPQVSYIYKGSPNRPQPLFNSTLIGGTKIFKQFVFGNVVGARSVILKQINFTNVEQVIDETYMRKPSMNLTDLKGRLFFEGRKTFWRADFAKNLNSGCCDRLRPLHTNRMMTKSSKQQVVAPVLFLSNNIYRDQPIIIRNLDTADLVNRQLAITTSGRDGMNLNVGPPENYITLNNLIGTRLSDNQAEILKTLVFKNELQIDDAILSYPFNDKRLLIGVLSLPRFDFDLSHDNYLIRNYQRNVSAAQRVFGTVIVQSDSVFLGGLDAIAVNQVPDFRHFLGEDLVRLDRPSTIRGPVQFNAVPIIFNGISPSPKRVIIFQAHKELIIGTLNGMRIPDDIVILPPARGARRPDQVVSVRGPRKFEGPLEFKTFLNVERLVNGMQMPAGVIPLHLNDFVHSVGPSNLWFIDGINAGHVTVQSGEFDDLLLRQDVFDSAQDLIMQSVFVKQPDGSSLIRAPLRVENLLISGRGLLNGMKPHDIMELSDKPSPYPIRGNKRFVGHVEAVDCVFNDINNLANWTSHLIRIDRPNTIQTIHTKLVFSQPMTLVHNYTSLRPPSYANLASSLAVDRLAVEFYQNNNPANHLLNWNYSPEFLILQQALIRGITNQTGGRYRVLEQIRLLNPNARVNGIHLNDIVTLDKPFRFADRFVLVGKVEVRGVLRADRITSNYPIDAMDLAQFEKYRIPILGSRGPIKLNNLALAASNRASFVRCNMLNGISFNEFANSIMSLTKPQTIESSLAFNAPVDLEGLVRTESSVNGVKNFREFAERLKTARYSFENGLQCSDVVIRA